jgi:hypothetical protein
MWKENHHILFSEIFVTKKILLANLQIDMKYIALLYISRSIWVRQSSLSLQRWDRIIHTLVVQLINVELLAFLTSIRCLRQSDLTVTHQRQTPENKLTYSN